MKNIKTVRELLARIPVSWRDAEVAISDSISAVRAVRRVSLHENADGKRVVIIHETPVAIRGADGGRGMSGDTWDHIESQNCDTEGFDWDTATNDARDPWLGEHVMGWPHIIVCRFWKADDVYRRTLRSSGHPTDGRRSVVLAALKANGVDVP